MAQAAARRSPASRPKNDGLMPALFFLFFKKPRCRHASKAAPEPKPAELRDEHMFCANDVPMQQGRLGRQWQKDQRGRKHHEHEQQPYEPRAFHRRADCVVQPVFLAWRRVRGSSVGFPFGFTANATLPGAFARADVGHKRQQQCNGSLATRPAPHT